MSIAEPFPNHLQAAPAIYVSGAMLATNAELAEVAGTTTASPKDAGSHVAHVVVVQDEAFAALRLQATPGRAADTRTALVKCGGTSFLLVVVTIGAWQARIAIALVGKATHRYFEEAVLSQRALRLIFTSSKSEDLLEVFVPHSDHLRHALRLCSEQVSNPSATLQDCGLALNRLTPNQPFFAIPGDAPLPDALTRVVCTAYPTDLLSVY